MPSNLPETGFYDTINSTDQILKFGIEILTSISSHSVFQLLFLVIAAWGFWKWKKSQQNTEEWKCAVTGFWFSPKSFNVTWASEVVNKWKLLFIVILSKKIQSCWSLRSCLRSLITCLYSWRESVLLTWVSVFPYSQQVMYPSVLTV